MTFPLIRRGIAPAVIYLAAAFMGFAETAEESVEERPIVFQVFPAPRVHGTRESVGICLGMVASETDYVRSLQLSTGVSWAKRIEGLQFSGILNGTGDLNGVQLSCFNYALAADGIQISGVLNCTAKLDGTQIGIFNFASSGEGTQIGVFNFAAGEDVRSFGLFNFHRNAWVNLRAGADTPGSTFLTLQSGLGGYYCSLSAGYFYKEGGLSSSFAAGYRYDGKSFYLEGEAKTTQKYLSDSEPENSAGAALRAGIKTGPVFSIFCGGGFLGSPDDSPGYSMFVPGLYIQPELSLGVSAVLKR